MDLHQIIGYPLFLIFALEVSLGVLLLRQNPRKSPVHKAVAVFSFASAGFAFFVGVEYVRSSLGLEYALFSRLSWAGWLSIPAALQFLYYMHDEHSLAARWIGWILYPFWSVVLLLCLATDWVEVGDRSLIPFVESSGPLESPLRLIGSLMIVWVMVEVLRLRTQVSGIRRAQLNYFFHGTLIFAVAGSLIVGFLQVLGKFVIEPGMGAYFSFPWVLMTFYAITRYRLFDLHIIASRTLSIALLAGSFAVVHIGLVTIFEPALGLSLGVLLSLGLTAFLFFGTPLSRKVQGWVQGLVLKGKYDYQDILKESVKAVLTILDLDKLLTYIIETMHKSLGPHCVGLFLKAEEGGYAFRHGFGACADAGRSRPLDGLVVRLAEQADHALVEKELEAMLPRGEYAPLKTYLDELGAELIVPLHYKGRMRGVMILGQKVSKEHYHRSDIDLLETLAGHVAIALENARLYEEARRMKESLQVSEERFQNLVDATLKKYLSL